MLSRLVDFVRLTRPHFLAGGFVLYALGALIARWQGYRIEPGLYVLGQAFVTSLQLMTQYLNEYWDVEADALNQSRTPWSGGSGMLGEGKFKRETAFTAAMVCLAVGAAAAIWLALEYGINAGALALMLLIFLGAYSYSSPPFALAGSGFGELSASLVVAGFVPALGHILQSGRPHLTVLLATAPLVVLHFAMLLAFEFPDFLSDEAAGKRTLLVRLGRRLGASVHNAALVLSLVLAVAATFLGLPAQAALAAVITSPLLLLQIRNIRRLRAGFPVRYSFLTLVAVGLFALTSYFTAMSFWVLGS